MADVSNFKSKERSNVELPNIRVSEIGNQNWKNWFLSNGRYGDWKNCEKCRISNGGKIANLPIFLKKFWFFKL